MAASSAFLASDGTRLHDHSAGAAADEELGSASPFALGFGSGFGFAQNDEADDARPSTSNGSRVPAFGEMTRPITSSGRPITSNGRPTTSRGARPGTSFGSPSAFGSMESPGSSFGSPSVFGSVERPGTSQGISTRPVTSRGPVTRPFVGSDPLQEAPEELEDVERSPFAFNLPTTPQDDAIGSSGPNFSMPLRECMLPVMCTAVGS
jgi:hypothetical protein